MSIEKAYDSWSSQYDTNQNKTRDLDKKVTREILNKVNFKTVLELGCGTGKNTIWLQKKAEKILGVDFSEEMLNIAKKKIKTEKTVFLKADITKDWDWTTDNFDLVTCNLILEHIENLNFIFAQAFSKLKPGGYFFISELHPFKQYTGSKARFDAGEGILELETYTHHISEFLETASTAGFQLEKLNEGFDEGGNHTPRILSLLFKKP
ncbi:methyltransferase family protein [Christiangramia gaetbulicola]|uniref:Methyltransferase family protein n=1 Tax=Christiangramia gaetbulicola TaxID=703340 RepID=A0A2T6AN35_9FLAO|nr:class I SAM-dependent methyltransferase [Christiangramia gaetbulicola]PTX45231.1 methyltransferase family protein [Christiangramia gaetbulicola]